MVRPEGYVCEERLGDGVDVGLGGVAGVWVWREVEV